MPNSERSSVGYYVERVGPFASAVAFIALAYHYRPWLAENVTAGEISLSGLFSAVFGWAAIQTGFIFSVFGFVTTKTGGFVEKFRGTPLMSQFQTYVTHAMYMGFFLTIYCIPLMILKIDMKDTVMYWVVAFWFASFVWAFASFLRVALNFGRMVSVREADYIPG